MKKGLFNVLLTLGLLVLSYQHALADQRLKGSNTTQNKAVGQSSINMWGWQKGQTCQGKGNEIQWNVAQKRFACVTNPKITHVQ